MQLQRNEIKYQFDNCKICNAPIKTLKRKTVDGLTIAKCNKCDLEFVKYIPVSKMWVEDDNRKTEEYYTHTYSQVPPKFNYALDKLLNFLNSELKRNNINKLSLLDVGCGNGEFLLMCKDKGFIVAGVEQLKSAAELCMKRGLNNIYLKDIGDMEETFDIITLFDVAEHLEDPKSFLAMLKDRLNPEGIIYMETPRRSIIDTYLNLLSLISPIRNNRISREHVQLYSDNSIRILLENCGLKIISFETKQSLSWANKKQYIYNLGIRSEIIATFLEKISNIAIMLNILGHNKAIVIAKKN
ncbi:MAG: class I SAM-dependent methyltransferase [Vulcanimicrobiota bacterium]